MSVLDVEKLNEPISKKTLEDDGWVPCRSISDYSLIKSWKKKYITKLPDIGEYNGGGKGGMFSYSKQNTNGKLWCHI